MRQRILAILGAILLLAAAVAVRGVLVKDKSGAGASGGGGGASNKSSQKPVVACTPDLAAVCKALAKDGSIADDPPLLDLDEAASPPNDIDGWITWDPAPQIANFAHDPGGTSGPWDPQVVQLASARLAVLTAGAAGTALIDVCGTTVAWTCVGGIDLGSASIGVGDVGTAEGIARLGPVAEGVNGGTDVETLDAARIRSIEMSPASGTQGTASDQTNLQATRGDAEVGIVVGPDELLRGAASKAQSGTRRLRVLQATPARHLRVVLASRNGFDASTLDACNQDGVAAEFHRLGVKACRGSSAAPNLAGFMFQVREKAQ